MKEFLKTWLKNFFIVAFTGLFVNYNTRKLINQASQNNSKTFQTFKQQIDNLQYLMHMFFRDQSRMNAQLGEIWPYIAAIRNHLGRRPMPRQNNPSNLRTIQQIF